MAIDARTLVKDVALAGPRARALLDQWRIDYCGHGGDTLGRACAARGVDAGAAVAQLGEVVEETRASSEWGRREVIELVDVVTGAYHPATRDAIARVEERLRADARSGPTWEALRDASRRVAFEALAQMKNQDDGPYAHARALARARDGHGPWPQVPSGRLLAGSEEIRRAHVRLHDAVRALRDLAEAELGAPGDAELLGAIRALWDQLTWQMLVENNVLLPRVIDLEPASQRPEPSRP